MSKLVFEGDTVEIVEGDSALDSLLTAGKSIPNSCRAGICQSCLVKADLNNSDPEDIKRLPLWQRGLSEAQVELNYMLACQCHPSKTIAFNSVDFQGLSKPAHLVEKTWLNDHVIRLRMDADLDYKSGQYVTLWKDDKIARSYSIASDALQDKFIEFHVKYIEGGEFSAWAGDNLEVGETIGIQGPLGKCFYGGDSDRPLLMSGIGTGLAPLLGILKTAIGAEHKGKISLVLGGKTLSSFYLIDELNEIVDRHENVDLKLIYQEDESAAAQQLKYPDLLDKYGAQGDVYDYVKESFSSMGGFGVYLCGAESFVKKMRRNCFMAGAAMQDISADAFVASGS